ncbi:MAG: hypothetical protein ACQKBY_02460 [Verrucomicrobiales bacterium]
MKTMKTTKMTRKHVLAGLLGSACLALVSCAGGSLAAAGAKPYPYDTCIVSGNKLGSMGDPVTKVHQGQEVKFCCQPCVKKFEANPERYLSKI